MELDEALARRFMRIGLGHVGREYPNAPQLVMARDEDAKPPRELHPAFYGSYDWHSCVHGWWMLLTLARKFPGTSEADEVASLAETTFTAEKLAAELAYFERPTSRGFERPYGWAWLLQLHREAARHEGRRWGDEIEPLARHIADRLGEYLDVLTYPITVGTHYNTAFALVLADEWCEGRAPDLGARIARWSRRQFAHRSDYRGWEPGGDEFLSPVLTASLLMSNCMAEQEWADWLDRLIIANGWLERECRPVTVSDRSDGKIAHLDGLNLSRAWCLRQMASRLSSRPEIRALLEARAEEHLAASLPHVAGAYEGEHWLASFALLALLAKR